MKRVLVCLLVLTLCAAACSREKKPPNIVLITVDTLRPDRLGYGGNARPTSPRIDRLASEANRVFEAKLVDLGDIVGVAGTPMRTKTGELTLVADGFRVLAAGSVQQARELAARSDAQIDLLLTDVNLPDGGGTSFARELRAMHPDLVVIVMSGAFEAPSGNDRFVAKPIDLEQLIEVLRVSLELPFDRR